MGAARRLVYEEPGWAALVGQEPTVSPLVTEFLVEATSGGTCVVTVVSSAFGTGADWEGEFFDSMAKGLTPMFDHLRLYLVHFPGQRVTPMEAGAVVPGSPAAAMGAVQKALGATAVGQSVDVRGVNAQVERIAEDNTLLRLTDPVAGLLAFYAFAMGESTTAPMAGYLFSEGAAGHVEREQPVWQSWLDNLAASVET